MAVGGWPAIEDHPPGLDRAYWRSVMSRSNVLITAILGVVVAIALAAPSVRAYLHLASTAPAWLVATWPITVGIVSRIGEVRFPPPAPWLALFFVHGIAAGSSIGAASELSFSAGWALLLMFPASWGFPFPYNRTLTATLVLVPPLARWILAPVPTVSSVGYAAALGLLSAASLVALSARRLQLRAREDAILRDQTFGAAAADDAGPLLAAMRVHDGLSGSLMLAHTRAQTSNDADAIAAARAFIRKARLIVVGFTSPPATTLDVWLGELARDFGLEIELVARGPRIDRLPVDVHDVIVELLGNQARHGEPGPVRLVVDARRTSTRIELRAPASRAPNGEGRGTRNLGRRVGAAGGTLATHHDAGIVTLTITMRARIGLRIAGSFIHAAPAIVAYAWSRDFVVTAAMAGLSVLLIGVANASNVRVVREHTRRQRATRDAIDQAARPTLDQVKAELSTALTELGRAADADDAAAVRQQLAQLTTWMAARLRELEASPVSRAVPAAALRAPLADESSR